VAVQVDPVHAEAVAIMVRRHHVTEATAERWLRRIAHVRGITLTQVCEALTRARLFSPRP
jgi:hypothetical protein